MPVPPNTTCATATQINALPFSVEVDTTGAPNDPDVQDLPCGSGNSYNALWYKWTCPAGVTAARIGIRPNGDLTNPTIAAVVAANPSAFRTWEADTDFGWEAPGGNDDCTVFTTDGLGHVFQCELDPGDTTGGSPPDWATAVAGGIGSSASDNDIDWFYVGNAAEGTWGVPATWSASSVAPLFAYPTTPNGHLYAWYPDYGPNTGSDEPDWPTNGDYVSDGDGYWQDLGPYSGGSATVVLTMFAGACAALTLWKCASNATPSLYQQDIFVVAGTTYRFLLTSEAPGGMPELTFQVSEAEDPDLGFCIALAEEPAVLTNLTLDCDLDRVTVTGSGITPDAVVTASSGGSDLDVDILSTSSTELVLSIQEFVPGSYLTITVTNPGASAATVTRYLTCPPPPPPTVTPGQPYTLVYDTRAKRFMLDYSALTSIGVRLEEPGSGVYNQVVGGGDGSIYEFSDEELTDEGTPIEWNVWTKWPDGQDPRLLKQWGDVSVDLDAHGSHVGIEIQPVAQDGTIGLTAEVVGAGDSGRQAYVISVNTDPPLWARNFGLRINGETNDADGGRPRLYWWDPSFIGKAPSIGRRATDWDDLGYVGAKFIQGIVIRANTDGVAKSLLAQRDSAAGPETMITFDATHTGESQIAYPKASEGWTPFVAELVRLQGNDDLAWQFLGARWVWEPAPELATEWTTQFTAAGAPGYLQFRDLVVGYEASATVTFGLTYDDGTEETYELPSTGGVYRREYVVLRSGKGKSARFRWTSDEPFRLYKKDISLRLHAWGTAGAYAPLNPFGGPSYESGAQI